MLPKRLTLTPLVVLAVSVVVGPIPIPIPVRCTGVVVPVGDVPSASIVGRVACLESTDT